MNKETGGQAFPFNKAYYVQYDSPEHVKYDYIQGMTLRDYFMAHAPEMPMWFTEWRDHYTSERAYFDWRSYYADVMIKKRKS